MIGNLFDLPPGLLGAPMFWPGYPWTNFANWFNQF